MPQTIVTSLIAERSRTDLSLRGMTGRTRRHFDELDEATHRPQSIWGGDLSVLTPETESLSPVIRRSLSFEKVMLEMPIDIEPYALLAGLNRQDGRVARCVLPFFIKESEMGQSTLKMTHKCPDYQTLLTEGLEGIIKQLEESRAAYIRDHTGVDPLSADTPTGSKQDFCAAVERECRAVIALSHRYADLAEERAGEYPDDRQRLLKLAEICRRVPQYPARTFHEAVQSLWFVNHAFRETMTLVSMGNVDRLWGPFFERDFEAGAISLVEAQEIIDEFHLRVNDRTQVDVQNFVRKREEIPDAPKHYYLAGNSEGYVEGRGDGSDAINHWGQNILIGGLMPDGTDATNPVTYMILNAHEKFQLISPVLTVRLHSGTPDTFYKRAAEVLRTGGGMPFINNDDVIIPAYEQLGVSHEDACNYANSNCWETLIQGACNQEMIRGVNFLRLLEYTLNRGKPAIPRGRRSAPEKGLTHQGVGPGNPVTEGIDTGSLSSFNSIADVMVAWKAQLDHMLDTAMPYVDKFAREAGTHGTYSTNPLLSALMKDCVKNLTDISHGGARYNLWHVLAEAVSNAADAFSAIDTFVFQKREVTLTRLAEILRGDWEGEEVLRQRILTGTERFGNGLAKPDAFAEEMLSYFNRRVQENARQAEFCMYAPCVATFSWVVGIGKGLGASADGRHKGDPIAANMSPAPGADTSGPTAAIGSYFKLPVDAHPGGSPVDLRINKNGLEGEEGLTRLKAVIEAFIKGGGTMLTITVTSADELRRAMAEPGKYKHLRVRMGGWSAYFTMLSEEAQRLQIMRAENR